MENKIAVLIILLVGCGYNSKEKKTHLIGDVCIQADIPYYLNYSEIDKYPNHNSLLFFNPFNKNDESIKFNKTLIDTSGLDGWSLNVFKMDSVTFQEIKNKFSIDNNYSGFGDNYYYFFEKDTLNLSSIYFNSYSQYKTEYYLIMEYKKVVEFPFDSEAYNKIIDKSIGIYKSIEFCKDFNY